MSRTFTFLLGCFLFLQMQAQEENAALPTPQGRYEQALERLNNYQYDRALDLLSACYKEYANDPAYLSRLAYCYFQLGRYPDAKLFYNSILKLDSTNTQAISSLGSIFEKENNQREQFCV